MSLTMQPAPYAISSPGLLGAASKPIPRIVFTGPTFKPEATAITAPKLTKLFKLQARLGLALTGH